MKWIILTAMGLIGMSGMAQKQWTAGELAPSIQTTSATGEQFELENFRGKKVLLAFFRYAGCPICRYRVQEMINHKSDFEKNNIEVVMIFESPNDVMKEYAKLYDIPFTILADPELRWFELYGIQSSFKAFMKAGQQKEMRNKMKEGKVLLGEGDFKRDGKLTRVPADFLIDSEGRIEIGWYGTFVGDHLPLQRIFGESSTQ